MPFLLPLLCLAAILPALYAIFVVLMAVGTIAFFIAALTIATTCSACVGGTLLALGLTALLYFGRRWNNPSVTAARCAA
jgi:hypothetical protein